MRTAVGTICTLALAALAAPAAAHPPAPVPRTALMAGTPIAPFWLTDQDGRPFDLARARGAPVIVTFFYTGCVDTCPIIATRLLTLRSEMDPDLRRAVQFLFITVDPTRDRPAVLKAYAGRIGLDSTGWNLLTGSPKDIVAVGKQFQLVFRQAPGDRIDHTGAVYLLDRELAVRGVYPVATLSPSEVLHDLAYLVGTHR